MKRLALMTLALVLAPQAAAAEGGETPASAKSLAELLGPRPVKTTAAPSVAATAEESAPKAEPLAPMVSMIGFALGIGALLVGGAFFVKRLRNKGLFESAAKELSVEESLWVGRGQRLLLVSVGAERVLLGVTGSGFEGLAVLGPKTGPTLEPTDRTAPSQVSKSRAGGAELDEERLFKDTMKNELALAFKPSPSDRKKILERLNTL